MMSQRQLNIVGQKLRELRSKRGYTLARLAAKCAILGWDVTGGTLAKIETRQRSAYDCELFILKKALGAQTDELFPDRMDRDSLIECLNKPARR
jgi:transcriptional regulator with XRE-family HTH domain